ncbi:MAG TPA: hypothetical protein DCE23_05205 [Firmicutes bacterium]|nr:hypothetical protein [Bacillota bacterium]
MTVKKQEICNIIETLPDELSSKVIDYIEYLKFTSITNQAPEEVIVKDEEDLRRKLEKGIEESENGNVSSVEEVFSKIEKILVS